ncbi:hypothetical protein GCM10009347_26940 [Shewanella algicola]|uniref:Uncharacterized protein n=1 Tax=Shewanella algicola TaxID=640633 RepID=A0A9X1Z927_9GAMM|nr:hypothetical protein [Shewanella algicola]MCL1106334.1 hypothetical protein [Shewanella algicola]GGP59128.1 hypothetical protein GCM10009347_26940 [Shewanella algicola]
MANQPNRKGSNESPVRRKTGVAQIELKSEAVYLHMRGQSGEALNNSLYRLGELFKMTNRSTNKTTYNMLKEWFQNEIISIADNEIDKLSSHFDSLQSELIPGYSFVDIKNPDMNLEINIIHKSHIEVINIISKIDLIMDDIEAIALSGTFDDDIEQSSRNQALLILNNISSKIFKVTKPGKRNGGPFSPVFFLEGLQKGVFSLYPDAEKESNVVNIESTNDKNTAEESVELTEAV